MVLYNSGTQFKSDISYGFMGNIYNLPLLLSQYQGQSRHYIDTQLNVQIQPGQLAMFALDPAEKQNIFQINIDAYDIVTFVPYQSPVVDGDIVFATNDTPYTGMQQGQTWYYSNGTWSEAVNDKVSVNQPPLFQLYDYAGVRLDDTSTYPNSTFAGSKVFSYKINDTAGATSDPVLKIQCQQPDRL